MDAPLFSDQTLFHNLEDYLQNQNNPHDEETAGGDEDEADDDDEEQQIDDFGLFEPEPNCDLSGSAQPPSQVYHGHVSVNEWLDGVLDLPIKDANVAKSINSLPVRLSEETKGSDDDVEPTISANNKNEHDYSRPKRRHLNVGLTYLLHDSEWEEIVRRRREGENAIQPPRNGFDPSAFEYEFNFNGQGSKSKKKGKSESKAQSPKDTTKCSLIDNWQEKRLTKEETDFIGKMVKKRMLKEFDLIDIHLRWVKVDQRHGHFKSMPGSSIYTDAHLIEMEGIIEVPYVNHSDPCQPLRRTLKTFCSNPELNQIWLSMDYSSYGELSDVSMVPSHRVKVAGFALGTLVDLKAFIAHFRSSDHMELRPLPGTEANMLKIAQDEDLRAHFFHDKKMIHCYFRMTSGGNKRDGGPRKIKHVDSRRFQLNIKYSAINFVVVQVTEKNYSLHFVLHSPPLVYEAEEDLEYAHEVPVYDPIADETLLEPPHSPTCGERRNLHVDDVRFQSDWVRVAKFPFTNEQLIGRSNVLRINMAPAKQKETFFRNTGEDEPEPLYILRSLELFAQIPVYYAYLNEVKAHDNQQLARLFTLPKRIPFHVAYAFECITSLSYQVVDEIMYKHQRDQFMHLMIYLAEHDPTNLESSLLDISMVQLRGSFLRILDALITIYLRKKNALQIKEGFATPENVFMVRRAILTPTRLMCLPPHPILASRFMRGSDPDYSLRITIRDDDLDTMTHTVCTGGSPDKQMKFLSKYVKKPILMGIKICGRKYEFLGNSSSQLRDLGMVLYARDKQGRTAVSIRHQIGDLTNIRNVAKYVARLGLAFSQSQAYLTVPKEWVKDDEPDIKGGVNPRSEGHKEPYTFSDGIGMISPALAEQAYHALNKCQYNPTLQLYPYEKCRCKYKNDPRIKMPSAYQIRYGGCKGVVVVNPKLEELYPGKKIVIRDSMKKYESQGTTLELLKTSEPRLVYLNRPLITILDQLQNSVPRETFLKMQVECIKELMYAFHCECDAARLVKKYCSLPLPYGSILSANLKILSEPFFRHIMESLVHRCVETLRTKARIQIPPHLGRTMFGVLDEFGVLEQNQVFVQYRVDLENKSAEIKSLDGVDILVTRNPCMNPGDVRKLRAVYRPELAHIVDCVVFPAKGSRPHPDEMGGGDLDGDEYMVIWGPPKLLQFIPSTPSLFPCGTASALDRNVEPDDILQFFCSFIQNCNIGVIANAHLAFADQLPHGIFDRRCQRLAEKCQISLDFAKTGKNERLERFEYPTQYPDFMEKFSQKPTYTSERTLGQLYRQCRLFELCISETTVVNVDNILDQQLVYPGHEKYLPDAKAAFEEYRFVIQSLMKQFGIQSEGALLSGTFYNLAKYSIHNGAQNSQDLVESLIQDVFRHFNRKFEEEFDEMLDNALSSDERCDIEDMRAQKASAWYVYTHQANDKNNGETFYGLPWIITNYLVEVAERNRLLQGREATPAYHRHHESITGAVNMIDSALDYEQMDVYDKHGNLNVKQTIMSRLNIARRVLKRWLSNCAHLKVGSKDGFKFTVEKLVNTFEKITKPYWQSFNRMMTENGNGTKSYCHCLPSVGQVVVDVFRSLIDSLFNEEESQTQVVPNGIGFAALMTFQQFLRTQDLAYVWRFSPLSDDERINRCFRKGRFGAMPRPQMAMMSLHISLLFNSKFNEIVISRQFKFEKILLEVVRAKKIASQFYETRNNRWHMLLTVAGSPWSIELLRSMVTDKNFQEKTVKALAESLGVSVPEDGQYDPNSNSYGSSQARFSYSVSSTAPEYSQSRRGRWNNNRAVGHTGDENRRWKILPRGSPIDQGHQRMF